MISLNHLDPEWQENLKEELNKSYMKNLKNFIEDECSQSIPIYPSKRLILNALEKTPFSKVRVVILGQDPYHGPGQAEGLCFSVPKGVPPPPSLKNIFKELKSDLGIATPQHGSLVSWAQQGVLLLNTVLTVRDGEAHSHKGRGWELFTDAILKALNQRKEPIIYLLWGNAAQQKCLNILGQEIHPKSVVLQSVHPSPLSANRGFIGCRHFSKVNDILISWGEQPINWEIPS